MEKQLEFDLKRKVSVLMSSEVKTMIDDYYNYYKSNIGFLLFYPLMKLENRFVEEDPTHILAMVDLEAISWFVNEIIKRIDSDDFTNFVYDENEYKLFEEKYSEIKKCYYEHKLSVDIMDMRSIEKYIFEEVESKRYVVHKAFVRNKYSPKLMYYFMEHDSSKEKKGKEIGEKLNDYLMRNYKMVNLKNPITMDFEINESGFKKLNRIYKEIDFRYLSICKERAMFDLESLSGSLESEIINDFDKFVFIWSLFYYIASISNFKNRSKQMAKCYTNKDLVIVMDESFLLNQMKRVATIDEDEARRYLEYFKQTPNSHGTLHHFPFVILGNKVVFIPSVIMLNDIHFNIVNGHYLKGYEFRNRLDAISNSIVRDVVDSVRGYDNILVKSEYYYEMKGEGGKVENSDIDVAIYDLENNKLLIVECKWLDNIFLPNEQYKEVEAAVGKIYRKQISKHERYLGLSKSNIDDIFNSDSRVMAISGDVEIYYLIIEKRSQFHTEQMHMIPTYLYQRLVNIFSDGRKLKLDALMNEVYSLRTSAEYFSRELGTRELEIDGDIFVVNLFNLI